MCELAVAVVGTGGLRMGAVDVVNDFRAADEVTVEENAVLLDIIGLVERVAGVEYGLIIVLVELIKVEVVAVHDFGLSDAVDVGAVRHGDSNSIAVFGVRKAFEAQSCVTGDERSRGKSRKAGELVEPGTFPEVIIGGPVDEVAVKADPPARYMTNDLTVVVVGVDGGKLDTGRLSGCRLGGRLRLLTFNFILRHDDGQNNHQHQQ